MGRKSKGLRGNERRLSGRDNGNRGRVGGGLGEGLSGGE